MAESREQRIARWANDRRFMQVAKAFTASGVQTFVYARDVNGVRHRLDPSTTQPVCGACIHNDARVEFYEYATCVRCVVAT